MSNEPATTEEIERYKVNNDAEIERMLQSVMDRKVFVTLYSEEIKDFLVTSIVSLDKQNKSIYLGCGSDERVNTALLESSKALFSTALDQVKIQFNTPPLTRVVHDNELTFRAPYPQEVLRFQRREYFRLSTQITNPIKCYIPIEDGQLETVVVDISVGGIGILSYRQGLPLEIDKQYHGCRLELPDTGTFLVSLNVRTTFDITMKNGLLSHRLGCQFIGLPGYVENEIQRYILRAERERKLFQY